jgi:hypothetical protein
VGRIRFPITPAAARRFCEVARPARHGFKDQTRLDRSIRDTWEISRSRISIDEQRWAKTLTPQLEHIRGELGLPDGCRLKAQLHNLLIYAPGQFFVTHQDSEKEDEMVGTLVVNLPSRFSGGAMTIEHRGKKMVVGGSDKALTLIAFYADCHHEVRPIKAGYRVVLTYNLMLEGSAISSAPPERITALARSVREFFGISDPGRSNGGPRHGAPDRLVYLLDHQYTQRGLAWDRLKNSDAQRRS